MDISIKDLILRGADLNGTLFNFDRTKFLNASENTACIRKVWYGNNAKDSAAPQDWGFARRGKHGEKYFEEMMIKANAPLTLAGDSQLSVQDIKRKLSATPDGVLVYDDERIVVEFKTFDPRTNQKNLPTEAHVKQLEQGMAILQGKYAEDTSKEHRPISGRLVYMNASNFNNLLEFTVPHRPAVLDEMAKRAAKVLGAKSPDSLDREGKRTGECKTRCSFNNICGVASDSVSYKPAKANQGSRLHKAVEYLETVKVEEAAIKAARADATETIKSELRSRNTDQLILGPFKVKVTMAKGRASLDRKAVSAAGIDLSPYETVGQPSERLTVTLNKGQ